LLGLDLYHVVPVSRIRAVENRGKWLNCGRVEITFSTGDGEERKVLLYLKKHAEFIDKLKQTVEEARR
jgi:hypothetical protein